MDLRLFKTLWGHEGSISDAVASAVAYDFDGLDGPAPADAATGRAWRQSMTDSGLEYIAEITTAGSYVPDRQASLQQHLDSLSRKLEYSLRLDPLFVTCLGGCDAWPETKNIEFFTRAMEIARDAGIRIAFETHRGRAFFNPWVTERISDQLDELLLTCDFSHWCVVCERLVDTEIDLIEKLAGRTLHLHARVGYDQGPQVPDPAAPEYRTALQAHQGWWELIWKAQMAGGFATSTMTPEFGPDGYLHEAPYSREPVADLLQLNHWMAREERRHFDAFTTARQASAT